VTSGSCGCLSEGARDPLTRVAKGGFNDEGLHLGKGARFIWWVRLSMQGPAFSSAFSWAQHSDTIIDNYP
jgi:hypothetical protein